MKSKIVNIHEKRTEQLVINISIKMVNAIEMIRNAKLLVATSEEMIIQAQLELEELYLILDEDSLRSEAEI